MYNKISSNNFLRRKRGHWMAA